VDGVCPTGEEAEVYNLEVEGEHEYFANGILVHNCIAWMYALRGLKEVYHYDDPKPVFPPGSFGEMMKLDEKYPDIFKPKPSGGASWWLPPGV
jgi:hypothetical protein